MYWLIFEKKPFQFWREIWIWVVVIFLQLYYHDFAKSWLQPPFTFPRQSIFLCKRSTEDQKYQTKILYVTIFWLQPPSPFPAIKCFFMGISMQKINWGSIVSDQNFLIFTINLIFTDKLVDGLLSIQLKSIFLFKNIWINLCRET